MEKRFSLDEPMEVTKFRTISVKACEDYVKDRKVLSDAKANAKKTIDDEQRKVWSLINRKAEIIHRIISFIFYTICIVIYVLCWLFLIFSSNVDFSQYGVATVILAVIMTLALVSWAPFIWLIHLFKGDSAKSKVVWGIILAGTGVWTIGVVFSLIVYIISLLNNEYKLATKISKLKKYRRMLRSAKSKDEESTKIYQTKAFDDLRTLENTLGEYEWLYLEWVKIAKPIITYIYDKQRSNPKITYFGYNREYSELVRSVVYNGPNQFGDYLTPRRYMLLAVESIKKEFDSFVLWNAENELRKLNII